MVIRIIDAEEMICYYQSKESFIQGFKLGMEITTELHYKNGHSFEKRNLNNCGQFFMPKEEDASFSFKVSSLKRIVYFDGAGNGLFFHFMLGFLRTLLALNFV